MSDLTPEQQAAVDAYWAAKTLDDQRVAYKGNVSLPIPTPKIYDDGALVTGPRSLSGHPLEGDRIVRMIFMDAAGLSNAQHEPFIVIAGIILNADKQWKALGDHLSQLAEEYAPPEHRARFAFHATELFSGGKRFPRERYSREWRWNVLDQLVAIPAAFGLPIVWARVPRREVEKGGQLASRFDGSQWGKNFSPVIHGQVLAFSVICAVCERWMKEKAEADELAQMIMENDDHSRRFLSDIQRTLADRQYYDSFNDEHGHFRLSRIIYPMHFEEKTDSSALQVADVCAFALKRWCMATPESQRFVTPLIPHLVAVPKGGDWASWVSADPSEGRPS